MLNLNQKGSSAIETIAMAGLLLLFAFGGGRILKSTVTEIWLENQLYQILICVNEGSAESLCRQRALAEASTLPWPAPPFRIEILKNGPNTEGVLIWKNGKKNLRLDFHSLIKKDSLLSGS